jgi:hypothetical protein
MAAQPFCCFCSCSRSVVRAQSPHARQAQSPPTRLALQSRDAVESSDWWLLQEFSEVSPPSELRDSCGFALRGVPAYGARFALRSSHRDCLICSLERGPLESSCNEPAGKAASLAPSGNLRPSRDHGFLVNGDLTHTTCMVGSRRLIAGGTLAPWKAERFMDVTLQPPIDHIHPEEGSRSAHFAAQVSSPIWS